MNRALIHSGNDGVIAVHVMRLRRCIDHTANIFSGRVAK